MQLFFLPFLFFCTACGSLPQFYQAAEKIATDTAVKVEISQEVITPNTDCTVEISLINKTPAINFPSK
jgi:hypothetical protein